MDRTGTGVQIVPYIPRFRLAVFAAPHRPVRIPATTATLAAGSESMGARSGDPTNGKACGDALDG